MERRDDLLEALQVAILVIDRGYRITYANRAAWSRWGTLDRADGPPCTCHHLHHGSEVPCSRAGLECPIQHVLETGQPARVVHRHLTGDGRYLLEEVFASPLRDAQGTITHVIEEVRDVTELLQTKEVVERMRSELDLLRGLLPICAGCKRIRTSEGTWQEMEQFVSARSGAEFSHGLCPVCVQRLYPEMQGAQPP